MTSTVRRGCFGMGMRGIEAADVRGFKFEGKRDASLPFDGLRPNTR